MVELHRSFEGSIVAKDLFRLKKNSKLLNKLSLQDLSSRLTNQSSLGSHRYKKSVKSFLNQLIRTSEDLCMVTDQVLTRIVNSNIHRLELEIDLFAYDESIQSGYFNCIENFSKKELEVSTIISIDRENNESDNVSYIDKIVSLYDSGKISAVSLIGNERHRPNRSFKNLFAPLIKKGIPIIVETGEFRSSREVYDAVTKLKATRIKGGIRSVESPKLMEMICNSSTVFECNLSTNYLNGSLKNYDEHPIREIISKGISTIIVNDNPAATSIEGIVNEMDLYKSHLNFTEKEIKLFENLAENLVFS